MLETTDLRDTEKPLTDRELKLIDAWWRAANYLSVEQIYHLLDNPLLREPLTVRHIKPRLLGHWGTTPGLNFIYVHLNRVVNARNLSVIYVAGPGAKEVDGGREGSSRRSPPTAQLSLPNQTGLSRMRHWAALSVTRASWTRRPVTVLSLAEKGVAGRIA